MRQGSVDAVTLESARLRVVVQPSCGARISSAVDLATSAELLFQAPWAATPPPRPGADAAAWTAAWPGGWDVLFPNAGAEGELDGRRHGFHGDASLAAWHTVDRGAQHVVLRYADPGGLVFERTVRVDASELRVASEVVSLAERQVPFAFVEHLILGGPLVVDGTRIELAGGTVVPLADEGPPLCAPAAPGPWPIVERGSGPEDWSMLPPAGTSRFGALHAVPGGEVRVAPPAGPAVHLSWTAQTFPFLWLWCEREGSDAWPAGSRIRCLGIEPASVPTGEGVTRLAASGQASTIAPGARVRTAVCLRLE